MTSTEAAYVAGIIDGEGCVSLFRIKSVLKESRKVTAAVIVTNTRRELLEYLTDVTGTGGITSGGRDNPRSRECWTWQAYLADVQRVLGEILPYLRLKRRQAECVLEFLLLHGADGRIEPSGLERAVDLCVEVRLLNSKGALAELQTESLRQQYLQELKLEVPVVPIPCANCGKQIDNPKPRQRFCSGTCRHAAYMREVGLAAKQAPLWAPVPCANCGKSVERTDHRKRFCDEQCVREYRNKQRQQATPREGKCPVCGEPFTALRSRRLYCSARCDATAYRQRNAKPIPVRHLNCAHCSKPFETTHARKKYCSASCNEAAYRQRKQQE